MKDLKQINILSITTIILLALIATIVIVLAKNPIIIEKEVVIEVPVEIIKEVIVTPTPTPTPTPAPAEIAKERKLTFQEQMMIPLIEEQLAKRAKKNIYTDIIDSFDEYEVDLICRIAVRECIDQPIDGQRAVIEVILNRMISPAWPNTLEGVLSQKTQFETWPIRHLAKQKDIDAMKETLELVRTEKDLILPHTDYVYFSTKRQSYAKNYVKIEGHNFGTDLTSDFDVEEWFNEDPSRRERFDK